MVNGGVQAPLAEFAPTRPLGLYASWGARLGALFVDALLLGFAVRMLAGIVNDPPAHFWPVLEVLVATLYFPLCHSLTGQTVGKAAVGLKVFDSESLGNLSLGRAFLRWFAMFVLWIPVVPGLLDGLSPLWNEDSNQAWHDKIAHSIVMRVRGSGQGAGTVVPQKLVRTENLWTSPLLKVGSIAAFALGIVGIPATGIAAIYYSLGHGGPSGCGGDGCLFGGDSPAASNTKLVHALSIGGVTLALLALAVLVGVVQMRRSGLPLRLVQGNLVAAAASAVAFVALASFPATRHSSLVVGVVPVVSLVVCWVRIVRLPRRIWRAEA